MVAYSMTSAPHLPDNLHMHVRNLLCRFASLLLQIQGNDALKLGNKLKKKFYMREAIKCYTKGLEHQCKDNVLNAVLYSNRSHVHTILGNDRSALHDATEAIKLDLNNVKAGTCLCPGPRIS